MTRTAVVILNWNGRAFLEQFLPDVVRHTLSPDTEVIVADNGSEDDSVEWVTSNHPEVRIIRLDSNYGYAGGYNKALKQTEAEYYILLNSDVQVEPGWADKLITFMDMHPDVGACQPKIRSYSNPSSFEYAGAAGGYLTDWDTPSAGDGFLIPWKRIMDSMMIQGKYSGHQAHAW